MDHKDKQITEINRLYSEREDFALKIIKMVFKNSVSNRLDLNISFTINNDDISNEANNFYYVKIRGKKL